MFTFSLRVEDKNEKGRDTMLKRKRVYLIAFATFVVAIVAGIFIWWNTIRFDFSEHMRIMPCFVELMQRDFDEFEMLDPNQRGVGIRVRGFEETDTMIVDNRRLRLSGSFDWGSMNFCFGARINGEIVPFGDPLLYNHIKYGVGIVTTELGISSFFVDLILEEGLNIVESISGHSTFEFPAPIDRLTIKTVYIYFQRSGRR